MADVARRSSRTGRTGDRTPWRAVVIGGGIAGLAAAWRLAERVPSAEVTVLEAGPEIGGKLRLAEIAGVSVDVGAEALLARRPEGVALIRALGLGEDVITPMSLAAMIHAGHVNHPLPSRTMLGIPGDVDSLRASGVLTPAGLATVLAEPSAPPVPRLDEDVAVGPYVRRRLGDEVVERLVEPLLGGVYAGIADELSLSATMPALAARLRHEGGSLLAAAAAVTAGAPASTPVEPVFVSLRGGLARLPLELARRGAFTVRTGITARSVRMRGEGYAIECVPAGSAAREEVVADAVVIATPAAKAARLLAELAPGAAAELDGIGTASMAIVTMAYSGVTVPPGSGLLVGAKEGLAVKAVTLSSQKWPGFPDDLVVLRASIGRAGQTEDLQRSDSELIALAGRELAGLVGVSGEPIDAMVTRWGGALPQYTVGHLTRAARIRDVLAAVPRVAVCGASYDGIGIPACIGSAYAAVEQVLAR